MGDNTESGSFLRMLLRAYISLNVTFYLYFVALYSSGVLIVCCRVYNMVTLVRARIHGVCESTFDILNGNNTSPRSFPNFFFLFPILCSDTCVWQPKSQHSGGLS